MAADQRVICPASKLDVLITDWDAPEEELKKFDEQNIQVVVVEKEEEKLLKSDAKRYWQNLLYVLYLSKFLPEVSTMIKTKLFIAKNSGEKLGGYCWMHFTDGLIPLHSFSNNNI